MRGWLWVLLASACYRGASEAPCTVSCPTGACPNGLTCIDQICRDVNGSCGQDAAIADGTTGPYCYGDGLFRTCFSSEPNGDAILGSPLINTDSDPSCVTGTQQNGVAVCVYAAGTITVLGHVETIGSRPLVLLAATTLTVQASGFIDVASYAQQTNAPAGAISGLCGLGAPPTNDTTGSGGGGGAGGTWLRTGGNGGNGGMTVGGIALPAFATPTAIRGGCPGGAGASSQSNLGGTGGAAGGAVYLVAGTMLSISGKIDASGGGGGFPGIASGGGGGGTGGFIGLDAPAYFIDPAAQIYAIGGGGASGGGAVAGNYGPDAIGPQQTAVAAAPDNTAGVGGIGRATNGLAGGPFQMTGGGGGGGGGAGGFIGAATFSAFPATQPIGIQPPAVAM